MALTVPVTNTDPFCWLSQSFMQNSYKDDLMEFYDNNNNFYCDYQQNSGTSYQTQESSGRQLTGQNNNNNNFNMQGNNSAKYQCIDLVDSPPNSKEAWPAEYVKTIMYGSQSQQQQQQQQQQPQPQQQPQQEQEVINRKRKIDWMQSNYASDNGQQESGPSSKVATMSLKERRKSQGRLWADDIDLDLGSELMSNGYSSDSLLNFPNLTVFKQEVPSPPNQLQNQPRSPLQNINSPNSPAHEMTIRGSQLSPSAITTTGAIISGNQNSTGNIQNQNGGSPGGNNSSSPNGLQNFLEQNGFDGNSNSNNNNNNNGSNGNSGSSNNNSNGTSPSSFNDASRFQYVLAAATSIATKNNEETLTYLNQGQSYEIKLKKLGDLSGYRGKIMRSVIKICFHERRLQYMEREQICIWQASRPGERILDIDIPLSYGLIHVNQSVLLNTAEILWDPMKEVGVYIKVNCISTEFTPKKHGGEKGVPFRIQIETYFENGPTTNSDGSPMRPLHAAACQIKVFKLKGADRKHKQDRERIQKRPVTEQDKYHRSYDCTIFNEIPSDALVQSTMTGCYSPEQIKRNVSPILSNSPIHVPAKFDTSVNPLLSFVNHPQAIAIGNVSSTNNLCKMDQSVVSTQNFEMEEFTVPQITKDSTPTQLGQWLAYHRLNGYASTFAHFAGCDLLRMSKEDLIQICGLADGIRMFNILHAKAITPRLTIFVSLEANMYHAIYLHSRTMRELMSKLLQIPGIVGNDGPFNWPNHANKFGSTSPSMSGGTPTLNEDSNFKLFINGPNNILVLVNDEVLSNIKDESLFNVEVNQSKGNIIMKSILKNNNSNKNEN